MSSQCHGKRKSLSMQLNLRLVRRIELYTKLTLTGYSLNASITFLQNGECPDGRVAYIIIRNIKRECADMGGGWNLTPGDEECIDCHIDVCRGNNVLRIFTD